MIPTLDPIYCEDDDVFLSDVLTSFAFQIQGRTIYVLGNEDAYPTLKERMTITHRIESVERCGGLHKCTMMGSNGVPLVIFLTTEDIYHNLRVAESAMNTLYVESVC